MLVCEKCMRAKTAWVEWSALALLRSNTLKPKTTMNLTLLHWLHGRHIGQVSYGLVSFMLIVMLSDNRCM